MRFLTLKVFYFGSSSKPLIDKLFIVDEATGARYLRDLIKDAVNKKDDKIDFNAKDGEIQKIVVDQGEKANRRDRLLRPQQRDS